MRRTTLLLTIATTILLALSAADGQDAGREEQIASVEARMKTATIAIKDLSRELAIRNRLEDHRELFKESRDKYQAELTKLELKVAETLKRKKKCEKDCGWEDETAWGALGWIYQKMDKIAALPGGFGPRVKATKAYDAAVSDLEKFLATLDGRVRKDRVGLKDGSGGYVDLKTFKQLNARVRGLEFRLKRERSAEQIEQDLFLVRLRLENLKKQLESLKQPGGGRRTPPVDPDPVPRPRRAARVTAEVVEPEGHGRPEGFADFERCTWKFKLRLTEHNGVAVRTFQIVELTRDPADIQHRQGGTLRILRDPDANRTWDVGYCYLTVQKKDRFRGSWRGVLLIEDALGNESRQTVSWNSTGRPPVGPPQQPLGRVMTGPLDREKLANLLEWNRKRGVVHLAYPTGTVTLRVGNDGRASFDTFSETWQYRDGPKSYAATDTFTCIDGRLGPDGKCTGRYRSVKTNVRIDGRPPIGGGTTDSYWQAEPQADGSFLLKVADLPYRVR